MMYRIPVQTAAAYEVTVGGSLADAGSWLSSLCAPCRVMLVCDDTVAALWSKTVTDSLQAAGFAVTPFCFPHGESAKTANTVFSLLGALADAGFCRHDMVVSLGGGVTGDLAGLAAALYHRGIDWVCIPTTLLAAVDAAIGGKTAVDLPGGKNLIGAFHQPRGVLCDTAVFQTLPPAQYRNGMAELIKSAVVGDAALFSALERGECGIDAVAAAVRVKAALVSADEYDRGVRVLLNFGHTVAHAIEGLSKFTVPHGEAVAIGMATVTRAAARMGICKPATAERLIALLKQYGLPTATAYTAEQIADAAVADKKRHGDRITLVLPQEIGVCVTQNIPVAQLGSRIAAGWEAPA